MTSISYPEHPGELVVSRVGGPEAEGACVLPPLCESFEGTRGAVRTVQIHVRLSRRKPMTSNPTLSTS